MHTAERLPIGSTIELRFTILLDDPCVIVSFAKVVRHSEQPRGMGVEFVSMETEMRLRVTDSLARQRPVASGAPLGRAEISEDPQGSQSQ